METWKQFDDNSLTHSAAHHLFAIHELGGKYGGWARVSDIARFLGITRGSVSISLRGLKERGLVLTGEHHLVRLSPQGEKMVASVTARRTALVMFLSQVLGMTDKQAEVDSCKIEHLVSPHMSERLVHFMKFLTTTNAGDALRRFRKFKGDCSPDGNCEVCRSHCLLAQLSGGSPSLKEDA